MCERSDARDRGVVAYKALPADRAVATVRSGRCWPSTAAAPPPPMRETPAPGRWSCRTAAKRGHDRSPPRGGRSARSVYDTWSILDEPDLNLMAGDCASRQQDRMLTTRAVETPPRQALPVHSRHPALEGRRHALPPRRARRARRWQAQARRAAGTSVPPASAIASARASSTPGPGCRGAQVGVEFACEKASRRPNAARGSLSPPPRSACAPPMRQPASSVAAQPLPGRLRTLRMGRLVTRRRRRGVRPLLGHQFSVESVGRGDLGLPPRVLASESAFSASGAPDGVALIRHAVEAGGDHLSWRRWRSCMIWRATIESRLGHRIDRRQASDHHGRRRLRRIRDGRAPHPCAMSDGDWPGRRWAPPACAFGVPTA